ncbi:DNA-processing protein DprA [bacterium]|nr:DNA-processing protein DprA [bacterium]
MADRKFWVALNMVKGLTPLNRKKLLDRFHSPQRVLTASFKELSEVSETAAKKIVEQREGLRVEEEISLAKDRDVKIVSLEDEMYPANLKAIFDPPIVIYLKGEIKKEDLIAISVVGSRMATLDGRLTAERFSSSLALMGVTVVSGMARGIDSAAHWGALKAMGRTIAVLGSGLDVIYPPENRRLFEEIAKNGAVISEFPFGAEPKGYNFPQRNRIISGLSLGVVVIEAASKSGALTTANLALEQGREVFAVPGRVSSRQSKGTNRLIKEGAKLTESVDDILEEFEFLKDRLGRQGKEEKRIGLFGEEKKVYDLLSKEEPMHIDILTNKSGLSPHQVASTLMGLELKNLIRQLRGKMFVNL